MASWRKRAKRVGRSLLKVGSKVSRVARPLASAAGGYFFGAAGVAAVNAVSHYGHQYQATTAARASGLHGRAARKEGRAEAQRTLKHSLIAGGIGNVGALAMGGWGAGATGVLGQKWLGLGSGSGLFGMSNPFISQGATATITGAVDLTGAAALKGVEFGWDSLMGKPAAGPVEPGAGTARDNWNPWDMLRPTGGDGGGGGGGDTGAGGSFPVGSLNAGGLGGDEKPQSGMGLAIGLGLLGLALVA
jgi:hypothetical protein